MQSKPFTSVSADHRPLLQRPKAARLSLAVGNTKLYQLIADGELEVVKLGPRARAITTASIDKYIERHLVPFDNRKAA